MTTIPVELRELLEALSSEFWDDDLQAAQAKARTLLAEQPQADHSAQDLNMVEQPQAGAWQSAITILDDVREFCRQCGYSDVVRRIDALAAQATPQPPARHDQGDEVRRLREALKDAEKHERHRNNAETRFWCDQYKRLARSALSAHKTGEEA